MISFNPISISGIVSWLSRPEPDFLERGTMAYAKVSGGGDLTTAWTAARKMLKEFNVKEPPVPVIEMAQQQDLTVQFAQFPAERQNVSGLIDTRKKQILVNADETGPRQLFTVAHELGHWMLHREQIKDGGAYRVLLRGPLDGNKPNIEREADAFAADLLVPLFLLKQYYADAPVRPSRSSLARLFGVSEDVIRYRLKSAYGE